MTNLWYGFLDSLDSPGGHILILVGLMGFGYWGYAKGVMESRDVMAGAFGALLVALKDSDSNHTRNNGHGRGNQWS